ncbi:sensor domain-containing protein [Roseiconus lacunae]|uniref:sensor domain-containing protein n=1 Tax=Roseiconus lacunae TaxID=2605694 RepID=UPI001E5336AA|nr:EAL domain-containing protein [Roseiconus lacunae]MCD0463732.1 EAL domain-containing protein [Roseiconus lacunae]
MQNDCGQTATQSNPLHVYVATLQSQLRDRNAELAALTKKSEAMSQAQAEAIVRSAEIIDELERTKQRLSEARSAAEEAARDTQRLADTIFEKTHDGVMVFHKGICIASNDNALTLLRSDRSKMIGEWPQAFDLASFDDGSSARESLRQLIGDEFDEIGSSLEVCLSNQERQIFWAEVSVSRFSMKDADHLLVVVRDITARKQFEAELKRHRDFLDNIINAVPDQLAVTTTAQRLVVANDAYCVANKVERGEILGAELSRDELFSLTPEIEQQINGGVCESIEETRPLHRDGKRTMSVMRSMFQDRYSGENYVVATARDITEDRAREDRLRILASVFNSASEGVAILSSDGRVEEANPAFLSMLMTEGPEATSTRPEVAAIGKPLISILKIETNDFDAVMRQVENGKPWSGKGFLRQGDTNRSYWISLSQSFETHECAGRVILLVSDITELEYTQRKLRRQAMYDNLTGMPNRRYFRERLQQLIDSGLDGGLDGGQHLAVCFIDLDDFKHVNDSAGHEAGDQLLQAVSARIQQVTPEDAFVARFGGDEFAMILSGLDRDTLEGCLNRLIDCFQKPFELNGTEATVGLSIGATRAPEDAQLVDALMCNADIAMYAAKLAGKNRIRFFEPKMQAEVDLRHHVQSKLRQAIASGGLKLWYQPKVCAASGNTVGCEALVRWCSDEGQFIPPSEFIPIAEQTGLINQLGNVVFQLAAQQASRWHAEGINPSIAVNVSAHQMRNPRFVEHLMLMLEQAGAKAEWFELEITEHAMMDDTEYAASMIDKLSSVGFRVAIDDFGTGFSSLSYLKDFRIQTLKIDLSFVHDMIRSPQSNAVVRSIISLGRGLGLTVVAEGVETMEQASLLSEAGCTLMQGYYFAKPMPPEEYAKWLRATSSGKQMNTVTS